MTITTARMTRKETLEAIKEIDERVHRDDEFWTTVNNELGLSLTDIAELLNDQPA